MDCEKCNCKNLCDKLVLVCNGGISCLELKKIIQEIIDKEKQRKRGKQNEKRNKIYVVFINLNGIDHTPNENTFDTYEEYIKNIKTEYFEYEHLAKVVLVEIDETEIITILYEIERGV